MDDKRFKTPEDEIMFWRKQAEEFKIALEDTKEELEEFQISSRELEQELEMQLDQAESKNKELTSANSRLQNEVENLQDKLTSTQSTYHHSMTELEDELAQVKAFKDELTKYIRELEQSNDDLERAKRATVTSLEDFELRLNQALERNAFLENELDEKADLSVTVQRLKDEARDLRQELDVTEIHKSPSEPKPPVLKSEVVIQKDIIDSNKLNEEMKHVKLERMSPPSTPVGTAPSTPRTPSQSQPSLIGGTGTPLTPSARISALNIVGDLLRKVGALESKLASCRNFVKEQPRTKSGSASPMESPRAKRFNRGGPGQTPQSIVKMTAAV
ncbi:unnamed protein product [Owenia fusiformis]|uniref:NUDE domain-containing protein n=1 Tax=Owenia fusiformis TaxID=6347 RepID=A0A8J1U587_OWEFU|nr:unnamed protein product [Owenia fusiformis]